MNGKLKGSLKEVPIKYGNRTEYSDDVSASIARLQMIREDLLANAERIERAIEDLKRTREMARKIDIEEAGKHAGKYADNGAAQPATPSDFLSSAA